ncbi:hypothetical protein AM571_PA00289 (plasmid) [Rhizobium etli 8C-3]|uniref:Uncharacterized protein n=1 Tax=Rhizobium etli 8C-3 TaxID=538025 RepID=A0A1L5PAN6_RHIET|nr:hypothetical protein AM571_PA00289 [Rhizobium etli 8C-3]
MGKVGKSKISWKEMKRKGGGRWLTPMNGHPPQEGAVHVLHDVAKPIVRFHFAKDRG